MLLNAEICHSPELCSENSVALGNARYFLVKKLTKNVMMRHGAYSAFFSDPFPSAFYFRDFPQWIRP